MKVAETTQATRWDRTFPVQPEAIINDAVIKKLCGRRWVLKACTADLGDLSLRIRNVDQGSGVSLVKIEVNEKECEWRKRFAWMHGLYLVEHVLGDEHLEIGVYDFNSKPGDYRGRQANVFALDTLVPRGRLRQMAETQTNIERLSEFFQVSPTTVRRQLVNIGLLPRG